MGNPLNIRAWIATTLLISCLPLHGSGAPIPARAPQESLLLLCQQSAHETIHKLQAQAAVEPARIAVVIDDLGYNRQLGQMAVAMPAALTLAILPHSPHGQRLAEQAVAAGKEVIVHLPMSSIAGRPLDKGGLTETMDRDAFLLVLRGNLQAIPQARGVNNHMGSLLTQQRESMQWLMEELLLEGLYFMDSRTTALSVAGAVAREQNLPVLERQVFLDNDRNCSAIGEQFLGLARIARAKGRSLAIGHPYPETLSFLAALLPHIETSGLELVAASRLLELGAETEADSEPENRGRD